MQTYTHHAFGHPCTDIFKVSIMLKFNSFPIFYLHGPESPYAWRLIHKWQVVFLPGATFTEHFDLQCSPQRHRGRSNTGTSHWSCFLDAFTSSLSALGFGRNQISQQTTGMQQCRSGFWSGNPLNSLRKLRQDVWSKERISKVKVASIRPKVPQQLKVPSVNIITKKLSFQCI